MTTITMTRPIGGLTMIRALEDSMIRDLLLQVATDMEEAMEVVVVCMVGSQWQ